MNKLIEINEKDDSESVSQSSNSQEPSFELEQDSDSAKPPAPKHFF